MKENNFEIIRVNDIKMVDRTTGETLLTINEGMCKVSTPKRCGYFYSNCLIEALKAKIKNPFKVKIKYMPAHLNEVFCPHLMWHDGEYTYDFYTSGRLKWYQVLWHKGHIRKSEYDYYDKCIDAMRRYKNRGRKNG